MSQFEAVVSFILFVFRNRDPDLIKHEVLSEDALPKPGSLVAIDAEFVSMDRVSFCYIRSYHALTLFEGRNRV